MPVNYRTVNPGSYIKVGFTGSSVAVSLGGLERLTLLTDLGTVAAKQWPVLTWSIDGGAWQTYQLLYGDSGKTLATGLDSGEHTLTLLVRGLDAYVDRWSHQTMNITITDLTVGGGESCYALTPETTLMLAYGDSITEAAWSLGPPDDLTDYALYQAAESSWAQLVADSFSCELGNLSFGGQGWSAGGPSGAPTFPNSWDFYYSGESRLVGGLFDPTPDWILINHGINGTVDSADVVTVLTDMRSAAGAGCKIALIIPFGQANVADLTTGFNNYQAATPDANCKLIDLGEIEYDTTDGAHPSIAGHVTLAALVVSSLETAYGL